MEHYSAIFRHIQNLVQCLHMQKAAILEILEYPKLFLNCIPMYILNPVIFENLQIFRTLAYLKSDTHLQPSYRVTGFDLTFQKWFVSLPNEVNNKTDLNVAHHVSEKKIFHSRLSKLALSSIFYLFIFLRISDLHLAPEVFNKKQTV